MPSSYISQRTFRFTAVLHERAGLNCIDNRKRKKFSLPCSVTTVTPYIGGAWIGKAPWCCCVTTSSVKIRESLFATWIHFIVLLLYTSIRVYEYLQWCVTGCMDDNGKRVDVREACQWIKHIYIYINTSRKYICILPGVDPATAGVESNSILEHALPATIRPQMSTVH
jgi:hypothetical protein